MAPKNSISQLDVVLLGRRGLTARLGGVESQVRRLAVGNGGGDTQVSVQDLRPNLFSNSSFEYYDRGSTKPQEWTVVGGGLVSVGSAGVDGTNSLLLPPGASASQSAAAGVTVPHSSVVVSVAARSDYAGQKIGIGLTHTPGVQGGPIMRIDQTGGLIQSDDVPADGNWYRFYRQFILTGGAIAVGVIAQAGSGTLEVDAAKLEKEDGVAAWLEPTAYMSADWGAATHIRNLSAANIITGTLIVGGSTSENPRISVKDGADVEIITIGDPTGGFYGIEVKGAAGFLISGSGSAEVSGGGSIKVKGGGDITIEGGDLNVTSGGIVVSGTAGITVTGGGDITVEGTGELVVDGSASFGGNTTIGGALTVTGDTELAGDLVLSGNGVMTGDLSITTGKFRVGTPANQRVELVAGGLSGYSTVGFETVKLDAATGKLMIKGAGALDVAGSGGIKVSGGGNITIDDAGDIILTGSGKVLAGPTSGYHTEMSAGGVALYGNDGLQNILLSSITGKVHVFDDSLVMENGGKLTYVSGLVWADNKGFWAMDAGGNAAFAVSGTDGNAWGNLGVGVTLDKGDVLIGNSSKYLWWDSSAGTLKLSGSLYAQNGNISIDTSGVYVQLPAAQDDTRAFGWKDGGGVVRSIISGYGSPTDGYLQIDANKGHVSTNGYLNLTSFAAPTGNGTVSLQAMKWNAGTSSYGSAIGISGDTTTQLLFLNGANGVQVAGGIVKFGSTRQIGLNSGELMVDNGFYLRNMTSPSAPFSRLYPSHTNDEFGNPFYTNLNWNGNGTLSVPNAVIQAPYFRLTNGQQWQGYNDGARNYLRGGNVFLDGRMSFASNNPAGTYFYSDDGNRTAHQGNIVVWGDMYVNSAGGWLSGLLNQAVRTTSTPTFGNVTITGVGTIWGVITDQAVRSDSTPTFGSVYSNSWFRSNGNSGWYSETYAVGWWATSAGLLRNYNNAQLQMTFATDKHIRFGLTAAVLTGGSNNGGAIYFGVDSATATQQTAGIETSWGDAAMPRIAVGVTRDGGKASSVWFYDQSYVLKQTSTNRMRMGTNGNISIGTTTTDVSWNLTMALDSAAKPNGGSWINTASDARTKTVNGEYEYGLEAVRKLRLVRYTYNGLGGSVEGLKGVGFIAQEAREVIPEMVGTRMAKLHETDEAETEILTLSNDPAIYATMKGVQELADLVDGLTAKVSELEARLDP